MTADPTDDATDDLKPLSLRQKVANKAFNKALDRGLGAFNAVALGIIGYGAIKEAFDALTGTDPFGFWTFAASIAIGVGGEVLIAYFTLKLTRRED